MTELLTAAQMRAIEQAAIDSGKVTGLELMERAGVGVVEAVFEEWPHFATTSHHAVVLCGPGNNGGDGFVIARLLKQRGWDVDVFLYGDPEKLPPDARANYERWNDLGEVRDIFSWDPASHKDEFPDTQLAIDAIFGTGLSRPFHDLGSLQDELNYWQSAAEMPMVVSVDIPSGICADSGRFLGYEQENPLDFAILANLTVTFELPKTGHYLADAPHACGKLVVKPIRIDAGTNPSRLRLATTPEKANFAPLHVRALKRGGHKYHHGHAVILSGPANRTGAARLAARGALRIGAGLVTVASPTSALPENAAHLTAVMLREVNDASGLAILLEDERLNAVCLGPGLGVTQNTRDLVSAALTVKRKTVLDADALTAFENEPESLFDQLHSACVLTPHAGEFTRLFPKIAEMLNEPANRGPAYSKVDATRDAAARAGCTVLFKGPDTVIADETGRTRINSAHYERSAPWLATAGSGDILSGFITGLLARGFSPHDAASAAAWLHVECALSFGPGLVAEDIPEELPRVLRALSI